MAGITQDELAGKLDRDISTVSRWLKQKDLSYDKIILISVATGLDFKVHFPDIETLIATSNQELNIDFKKKYYDLVERHMELQERVMRYGLGAGSGHDEEKN